MAVGADLDGRMSRRRRCGADSLVTKTAIQAGIYVKFVVESNGLNYGWCASKDFPVENYSDSPQQK